MQRTFYLILLLGMLLSACAPATKAPTVPTAKAIPDLAIELAALPGARVLGQNPPVVSYPEQALFGPGAVLPLANSREILDPLAEMLKKQSGWRWEVTVRAVSAYGGDYDQRLAEDRARLLESYLTYRGVVPGTISFRAVAAKGTPFELRPLVVQDLSPASSSAEKQ